MAPKKVRAVGIKLMKSQQLFGGDIRGVLEVAKICDRMGVDEIHVSDHVLMTGEGHRGRTGFPYPLDWDGWYEPLEMLAAIASVTERVRLSSHVLIAPLRPAILLAKQLATLDVLSGGRVDIGLGVGWQSQEFAAAGVPFERRLTRLVEEVEACRALWGEAPAHYGGSTVSFDEAYSLPHPVQGADTRPDGESSESSNGRRLGARQRGRPPVSEGCGFPSSGPDRTNLLAYQGLLLRTPADRD